VRSSLRRLAIPLAIVTSLGLVGAACSKSADTTSTGSGGTTAGSAAPGPKVSETLSGTLNGSGATFPAPFYEESINGMKDAAPKLTINYGGGGSGKGKQELQDQVVQWAGTDSLVKEEDKAKFKGGAFLYFPTVAAPITVSYNVKGLDKLQLSGPTLGKIFGGKVTTWNDPAIAGDNPGTTLPSTPIKVVHRSDGSGTTNNFTKFLKSAGGSDWTLDSGDTVNWPADQTGANGNAGVAQAVKNTDGAVGYVDFSDAKASSLTFASIKNKDGQFVAPSLEGASAALATAEVKDDLTYSPINTAGAKTYPITASTYVIVYQKQPDATQGANIKGWLTYLLTTGQGEAASVDFAKLPDSLQAKAIAQLDKIQVG